MYSIRFAKKSEKRLAKIDKSIRESIVEKLGDLCAGPKRVGRPLTGELQGLYRLRVGDYRVIYYIDEKSKTVVITDIGHRSKIYNEA